MNFIKPTMGTIIFSDDEIRTLEDAYDILYKFYNDLGIYADVYDEDEKLFMTNSDVEHLRNQLEEFGALAENHALRYYINR